RAEPRAWGAPSPPVTGRALDSSERFGRVPSPVAAVGPRRVTQLTHPDTPAAGGGSPVGHSGRGPTSRRPAAPPRLGAGHAARTASLTCRLTGEQAARRAQPSAGWPACGSAWFG